MLDLTFLQQILGDRLLYAVTNGKESNFNDRFKLKTCNNLPTRICCEIIVKIL